MNLRLRTARILIAGGNRGQSTIEYLIITFTLIAALITLPSIYETMSHTMTNKYQSYTFGIAISDPPRKAFDDTVQKDTDRIYDIFELLEKIEDMLSNISVPDLGKITLPGWDDIKSFAGNIKSDIEKFVNKVKKKF